LKAKFTLLAALSLASFYICGCASSNAYKNQFADVDAKLTCKDYKTILMQIEEHRSKCYKKKDIVLYYLDTGLLKHYDKQWSASSAALEQAERAIEESYTKSISHAASSMMLNDNALVYAGEEYEDVYLNIFNSLNYIHAGKFEDAMVEVRRIGNKLDQLEDRNLSYAQQYRQINKQGLKFRHKQKYPRFYDTALGRYISMLVYRAAGKMDDARIDLEHIGRLWKTAPNIYTFRMPPLQTALQPSPEGYAKLNVISFVGRLPDKYARTMYITTRPHSIVISRITQLPDGKRSTARVESIPWSGRQLPDGLTMKFETPYMKVRPGNVCSMKLMINNQEMMALSPIESMGTVALETFKVKVPLIYMRTVLRVVLKAVACIKIGEELRDKDDSSRDMAELLLQITAAMTEDADLRVSQFFPELASVCEVELPVGSYQVKVVCYDRQGRRIHTDDIGTVNVRREQLNLVESHYLN